MPLGKKSRAEKGVSRAFEPRPLLMKQSRPIRPQDPQNR
nr:MAG TPA: hypothetical protein [Caudoviricetes sp.]